MSKAYLFAMFLLAASFTGCLGGDEEDTIEPVGEEDNSGQPGVEFIGLFEDYDMYLVAAIYDPDGYVLSYTIQSSTEGYISGGYDYGCEAGVDLTGPNSDSDFDCFPFFNSVIIDVCYGLDHVNQKITIEVKDNDGNTASAEYNLVYDDLECEDEWEYPSAPIATFLVQEDSSGVYHVDVIKVSKQEDLTNFSFYLKDDSGSTYVGGNGFGEIAMQNIDGEEHGIDTAYDGDDEQLVNRVNNVSNDDGTDFPVHFNDNDYDGKLSAGDSFRVYGYSNGANGPASDNWRLDIQYDPSGDIIGSAKLM